MLKLLGDKIRKAFSESADQYDILSSLQKEIGRELVKKNLGFQDCDRILDIGTGTGYVANKLKFFYPESDVYGMDFAPGMLDVAKQKAEGIELIQANALHLPFKSQSIDYVISNLMYQWVGDLEKSFSEVSRVLKRRGKFRSTIFGSETLRELFACFEMQSYQTYRLASKKEIREALCLVGFSSISLEEEIIEIEFSDVWSLLKWLKNIGANVLGSQTFLGKQALERVNQDYRKNYPYHHGIRASFEVIWVKTDK